MVTLSVTFKFKTFRDLIGIRPVVCYISDVDFFTDFHTYNDERLKTAKLYKNYTEDCRTENDQALRPPSQANGKSVTNSKKHLVRVSKLPDGNIQLTAAIPSGCCHVVDYTDFYDVTVPQRCATVTVNDSISYPRPTTEVIRSPSLGRLTLNRLSSTAISDAQPESSNLDVPNRVTQAFVPATPLTTNSASASIKHSDKRRQDEHLQNHCEHCGDRLDEIKRDLKRLEEKFDSMLTVFSTFLLTTTPLKTQSTTNDIATNRTPPIMQKPPIFPSGGASLQAQRATFPLLYIDSCLERVDVSRNVPGSSPELSLTSTKNPINGEKLSQHDEERNTRITLVQKDHIQQ
uniref:Uncharacterized protein n=1 Tax=Romanomermis culicivorax TaxID=13658 RepID=A0A915JFW4_ROMCU